MSVTISRRRFQAGGLALLAGAAGLTPRRAAAATNLRFMWWGGADRLRRTQAAFDAFNKKFPELRCSAESISAGQAFWAKLATQVAGGNAPDIYQMDYRVEAEFAIKGTALPLDQYMPGILDMRDAPAYARDAGKINGKTYAVSLGTNSTTVLCDETVFKSAGIPVPAMDAQWSWDEFARIAVELSKSTQGKVVGTTDFAYQEYGYQTWLRQRGKELYAADGQLGYTADDMAAWLDFWTKLRQAGGTLAPDVQALDKDTLDTNGMVTGKTAMSFAYSNQLVAYQGLKKGPVAITLEPNHGPNTPPGRYLKAALLACVYAKSKHPEEAVKLIDFMLRDADAVKALGVDRGVPNSAASVALVEPTLEEYDRKNVEFVRLVATKHSSPIPPPPPIGANEIYSMRRRTIEDVAFGRRSIADASRDYVEEAKRILEKARAG